MQFSDIDKMRAAPDSSPPRAPVWSGLPKCVNRPLTRNFTTVSVASLIFQNLPGITVLRVLRTLRVLRLFNKLRSLRTIINAIASSCIPVFHAFLIMLLVCIVYAILGVELFRVQSPEFFGSFSLSYWTVR